MTMRECPRYLTCSAPVCPLDPIWARRKHLPGERVCLWLTELAKPGGLDILGQELGTETAAQVARISPAIAERFCYVRRVVEHAAGTGSLVQARRQRFERNLRKNAS